MFNFFRLTIIFLFTMLKIFIICFDPAGVQMCMTNDMYIDNARSYIT